MNLHAVGGRRFLLSLIAFIGTFALTWARIIDGGVYATVVIATIGAYITGNVVEARQK